MDKVKKVGDSNRDLYFNEGDVHLKNYQYRIYKDTKFMVS